MVVIPKLLKDRIFSRLGIQDYASSLKIKRIALEMIYARISNNVVIICEEIIILLYISSSINNILVVFIVLNLRCHKTFIIFLLDLK